jgi:hypothetical protein
MYQYRTAVPERHERAATEEASSILGPEKPYPDRFLVVLLGLSTKSLGQYLKISHDRFLLHLSTIILPFDEK